MCDKTETVDRDRLNFVRLMRQHFLLYARDNERLRHGCICGRQHRRMSTYGLICYRTNIKAMRHYNTLWSIHRLLP